MKNTTASEKEQRGDASRSGPLNKVAAEWLQFFRSLTEESQQKIAALLSNYISHVKNDPRFKDISFHLYLERHGFVPQYWISPLDHEAVQA